MTHLLFFRKITVALIGVVINNWSDRIAKDATVPTCDLSTEIKIVLYKSVQV